MQRLKGKHVPLPFLTSLIRGVDLEERRTENAVDLDRTESKRNVFLVMGPMEKGEARLFAVCCTGFVLCGFLSFFWVVVKCFLCVQSRSVPPHIRRRHRAEWSRKREAEKPLVKTAAKYESHGRRKRKQVAQVMTREVFFFSKQRNRD